MRTRADRRHHRARVKANFCKALKMWPWGPLDNHWLEHRLHTSDTRCVCSCVMCGNPRRKWKEKTIQEKKFEEIKIEDEIAG